MNKYYKPMIPTLVEEIPKGKDWIYEAKYDGFRCLLYVNGDRIELISRNLNDLSKSFPEIISEIKQSMNVISRYSPLILDGEIVILDSPFRANFEKIQQRGRTKTESKITMFATHCPATFIAFDLLQINGLACIQAPLHKRKENLSQLFTALDNDHTDNSFLKHISYYTDCEKIWSNIVKANGEGIVAKRKNSRWEEGARTIHWLKIKNWKKADFFIISLEKQNHYFHIGLRNGSEIIHAGLFSHGLKAEEREALINIVKANSINEDEGFLYLKPSICVELQFLDWYKSEIRQPRFSRFQLAMKWEDCTWEKARKHSMKSP